MIGIAGWLVPAWQSPAPRELVTDMAAHCGTGHGSTAVAQTSAGAVRGGWLAQDPEAGTMTLVVGSPRWDGPRSREAADQEDPAAVLLAQFREHGRKALDRMRGAFACAVLDPARGYALAATDRLGRHPLYYAETPGGVVFGSTASSVTRHPLVDTALSTQGLYDYLYFHMVPAPGSIYRALHKLPTASRVEFRSGRIETERYWTPQFLETAEADQGDLAARLRQTIRDAVSRHVNGTGTGAFLSGGLDSSTVAGMLADLHPDAAPTFSIGFHADGYDELPYARIAARHFDTRANEYYVTPRDVADNLERIANAYDEPFGNSSALPAFFCARKAREAGIDTLLAGDGGDELFAGNARYAKQGLFERYDTIPAPVRRGLVEPLTASPLGALPGLRKVRSYVAQARIPLPDRMETYNFLHRIPPEEIFEPEFLAEVDTAAPVDWLRTLYNTPPEPTTALNRMMYLDWQITLADNDLRKVSQMCELAGVDVAFPMLDDDVVALSQEIPSAWKLPRGRLRGFYKDAFGGVLPREIVNKSKHGFGLPFGVWLREDPALREQSHDRIREVGTALPFRDDFLDRILDLHDNAHAAYYGDLIWVLTVLGIWLEQRPRPGAHSSEPRDHPPELHSAP